MTFGKLLKKLFFFSPERKMKSITSILDHY